MTEAVPRDSPSRSTQAEDATDVRYRFAETSTRPRDTSGVQDIPPIPDATILLVEFGSTAHGTGLPGVPPERQINSMISPGSPRAVDRVGRVMISMRANPAHGLGGQ